MPTAAVYRRFDEMGLGFDTQVEHQADWNQWCLLSSQDLLPLLINDLEPPAFALRPDLADLRSAIEKTTDRPVRMSGSGSSLFTLYDEHSDAAAAADFIAKRHHINASAIEMAPML
jgi:4-diphosphocytidyl-2C-methyl-D-erythritol kinase